MNIAARTTIIFNNKEYNQISVPGGNIQNERKTDNSGYMADILSEYQKNEKLGHRIMFGLAKSTFFTSYTNYKINGEKQINDENSFMQQYRFGYGITRIFLIEKFTFRVGIEIPFIISAINQSQYTSKDYDTSGTLQQTIVVSTKNPIQYFSGINFFGNCYYNFWNNFSIGIEIGNQFLYSKEKGRQNEDYKILDANNNTIMTYSRITEVNNSAFGTRFLLPFVGLSYKF